MTDPQTSYDNRDRIRAEDHDLNLVNDQRTKLILWLLCAVLPFAVTGLLASGGAWVRIAAIEARQNDLDSKIEEVVADNIRTDRLATRLDERSATTLVTIQRIERILEQMQRSNPRNGGIP